MPRPSRKTHVVCVPVPTPDAPVAEVRVAKDRLVVTVPMPHARLADVVLFVAGSTLTLRSVPGRGDTQLSYPLPAEAERGSFVAREVNGVWDIVILRALRTSH